MIKHVKQINKFNTVKRVRNGRQWGQLRGVELSQRTMTPSLGGGFICQGDRGHLLPRVHESAKGGQQKIRRKK